MKLLILGGTRFVGRHLAEAALARDWDVSLFHRGQSNPDILPEATHLLGDRLADLSALESGKWDACVDTCGYFPRAIKMAGEVLRDRVGHMAFVSTISVYKGGNATSVGSPVATVADPTTEVVDGETYGGLKVLCEEELVKHFPSNSWIVRPGIIAGPYDPTDRFTYWIDRVAKYKAFVKPARLNQPIQAVDARALGEFILDGLMDKQTQTVNTVGPEAALDFDHFLKRIRRELRADEFTLMPRPEDLRLPLELPPDENQFFAVDPTPAIDLGLNLPSIRTTIRSTYEWWKTQDRKLSTERPEFEEVLRDSQIQ